MSPKDTKLRAFTVPGSTVDIKERVNIRSDATTYPNDRQKTWNQIEKLFEQWQTRGLIPADDQPEPTKAHRRAVLDYEHEQCLQQLNVWREAEQRFIRVTSLVLHLEYASPVLADSIHVVQVADLPVRRDIAEKTKEAQVIQTPRLYLSLAEVPPPSPNVGFIEVLQFNGVSTDNSVK